MGIYIVDDRMKEWGCLYSPIHIEVCLWEIVNIVWK